MKLIIAIITLAALIFGPSCALADNLFVADSGSGNIYEFNTAVGAASQTTFASGLYYPYGLAFDSSGNLFEADEGSGNIYKFTPGGSQSTFASGLNNPFGLAFDSSGNLFEADAASGNIYKFTPNGSRSTFASGLSAPLCLSFDGNGNLYEGGVGSGIIYKFTPNGTRSIFASGLADSYGLAVDGSGDVFAAGDSIIYKFTPDGSQSTFASGLSYPFGLAFDSNGNFFEADQGQGHIFEYINLDGSLSPIPTAFDSGLDAPDFLAIQPVPEPSAWLLLILSVGILMICGLPKRIVRHFHRSDPGSFRSLDRAVALHNCQVCQQTPIAQCGFLGPQTLLCMPCNRARSSAAQEIP